MKSITPNDEKELKNFVKDHPNGTQILKLIGNWDYELEFEIENEDKLYRIIKKLGSKFGDIIKDYDTLLIVNEKKLNYFPF